MVWVVLAAYKPFHVLANAFDEVEADVESSHENDDTFKFRISPHQFLAPAVQWLVSSNDCVLLAYCGVKWP